MMEENLRRALLLSRGDWSVFVTRPLSAGLLARGAAADHRAAAGGEEEARRGLRRRLTQPPVRHPQRHLRVPFFVAAWRCNAGSQWPHRGPMQLHQPRRSIRSGWQLHNEIHARPPEALRRRWRSRTS
jgi:hypothetical protein